MRQFRVGVVGLGGISGVHIPALLSMDNVKIVVVCDIRAERARAAAERTGAEIAENFDALLARGDIDAVHILTPHYLHAPMAIASLRAGVHVLTEKPMATTLTDAKAMIETARESAARLGVIFQNRYNPASVELKRLVASGEGGKFLGARAVVCWKREAPYYTESGWRGSMQTEGGGALINQSIHTLDLLSYIPGRRIARVLGHTSTDLLSGVVDVETSCHAVAEYADGARLVLYVTNDYALDAPVTIEIACENRRWQIVGDELYDATDGMKLLLSGEKPALAGKAYWGASHGLEIRDFYDCLETGRPFPLEGKAGYPALNLVKAIQESAQTGKWVNLDNPEAI